MNSAARACILRGAAIAAILDIGKDWNRCDEETGRECRGFSCQDGSHRAIAKLHDALMRTYMRAPSIFREAKGKEPKP